MSTTSATPFSSANYPVSPPISPHTATQMNMQIDTAPPAVPYPAESFARDQAGSGASSAPPFGVVSATPPHFPISPPSTPAPNQKQQQQQQLYQPPPQQQPQEQRRPSPPQQKKQQKQQLPDQSSGSGGMRFVNATLESVKQQILKEESTPKKKRVRTSNEQLEILQRTFAEDPMPSSAVRNRIAEDLGMSARSVQVWFQNRRAKVKLDAKRGEASAFVSMDPYGSSDKWGSSGSDNAGGGAGRRASFCPSVQSSDDYAGMRRASMSSVSSLHSQSSAVLDHAGPAATPQYLYQGDASASTWNPPVIVEHQEQPPHVPEQSHHNHRHPDRRQSWASSVDQPLNKKGSWQSLEQPLNKKSSWGSLEQPLNRKESWASLDPSEASSTTSWVSLEPPVPDRKDSWASVESHDTNQSGGSSNWGGVPMARSGMSIAMNEAVDMKVDPHQHHDIGSSGSGTAPHHMVDSTGMLEQQQMGLLDQASMDAATQVPRMSRSDGSGESGHSAHLHQPAVQLGVPNELTGMDPNGGGAAVPAGLSVITSVDRRGSWAAMLSPQPLSEYPDAASGDGMGVDAAGAAAGGWPISNHIVSDAQAWMGINQLPAHPSNDLMAKAEWAEMSQPPSHPSADWAAVSQPQDQPFQPQQQQQHVPVWSPQMPSGIPESLDPSRVVTSMSSPTRPPALTIYTGVQCAQQQQQHEHQHHTSSHLSQMLTARPHINRHTSLPNVHTPQQSQPYPPVQQHELHPQQQIYTSPPRQPPVDTTNCPSPTRYHMRPQPSAHTHHPYSFPARVVNRRHSVFEQVPSHHHAAENDQSGGGGVGPIYHRRRRVSTVSEASSVSVSSPTQATG
ncbi:hypothetical protein HK104_003665, partial [Borealophlyctis nickersoniae]